MKHSKRMLPRINSVAEDFMFTTSTSKFPIWSPLTQQRVLRICHIIQDTIMHGYGTVNHTALMIKASRRAFTMEPPLSLVEPEVLSASSGNSETNPFSMTWSANDGYSSFRETASKRQCTYIGP